MKGASPQDAGQWSCEVGSQYPVPWTLVGDIDIKVDTVTDTTEASFSGVIQANTTLLAICIVVFVIFLSILLCVAVMFGRSQLQKRNFETRKKSSENLTVSEDENQKDDSKSYGDNAFLRRVLPHIIKFPLQKE